MDAEGIREVMNANAQPKNSTGHSSCTRGCRLRRSYAGYVAEESAATKMQHLIGCRVAGATPLIAQSWSKLQGDIVLPFGIMQRGVNPVLTAEPAGVHFSGARHGQPTYVCCSKFSLWALLGLQRCVLITSLCLKRIPRRFRKVTVEIPPRGSHSLIFSANSRPHTHIIYFLLQKQITNVTITTQGSSTY